MRNKLTWTILAIAMVSAAAPARAQTYDPNYPVCLQVYDDMVHRAGSGNLDSRISGVSA